MCPKVGNRFQGKAGTASRTGIVLRFLAGCQPEEMGMFIDLLLEPVCHHAEGIDLKHIKMILTIIHNIILKTPIGNMWQKTLLILQSDFKVKKRGNFYC